jgi:hypothetical protein
MADTRGAEPSSAERRPRAVDDNGELLRATPRADLRRLLFIPLIVVDEVGYISSTSAA